MRIYDFGETEATYYLVMEEVQGSSYLKRWRNWRWLNDCEFWPRWPKRLIMPITRGSSTATSSRATC